MSECWIGLGANLGDAQATFDAAWILLRDHPQIEVRQRSGLYRTAPVGANAGEAFLNAVCSVSTTLAPLELLDVLQSIERTLGRTREIHWGPRTLDLDLLFVDEQIIREPRLTVPHPAACYRRFVIDPLAEIAPNLTHPPLNLTALELRQRLQRRPLVIALDVACLPLIEQLRPELTSRFPNAKLVRFDSLETGSPVDVQVRVDNTESAKVARRPVIMADLSASPGDPPRRMIDFLTAVFDEPERVGDW